MIKAVLFDKDGTLIHFKNTWLPILNNMVDRLCQKYHIENVRDILLEVIGVSGTTVDARGIFATKTTDEITEVWQPYFDLDREILHDEIKEMFYTSVILCKDKIELLPGVKEALQELKNQGYHLGVATADTLPITKVMLESLGVIQFFEYIGAEDGKTAAKPNPYMLEVFCKQLDITNDEVIMVGDTLCDMKFGKNAGVKTVGVLGTTSEELLAEYADVILPSVANLVEYLNTEENMQDLAQEDKCIDKAYVKSLEERIIALEKILKNIVVGENKTLTFTECHIENIEVGSDSKLSMSACPTGEIRTGDDAKIKIENSPIGVVIDNEIDDAEERIEELEDRLEDLNKQIDATQIDIIK